MPEELLSNLDKIHTTPLGQERIKRNLNLSINLEEVVPYCVKLMQECDATFRRQGKNWYVKYKDIELTINAYSFTIITAHRVKSK